MSWMRWRPQREKQGRVAPPRKAREPWSRGDKIGFVTCVAAILVVPAGLLEVLHIRHEVRPEEKIASSAENRVQPPTGAVAKLAEQPTKDGQKEQSSKVQDPKTVDHGSTTDWAEVREETDTLPGEIANISEVCEEASKRFARCSLTLRSADLLRDAKSYMYGARKATEARDIESARKNVRDAESKIELLKTVCSQHPACGEE